MKRFICWMICQSHCVTNPSILNSLNRSCNITNIPSSQEITTNGFRSEDADFSHVKGLTIAHELNGISWLDHTVHNPHLQDYSTIGIVNRIKNESLERCCHIACRCRNFLHDLLQDFFNPDTSFSWSQHSFACIQTNDIFNLCSNSLWISSWKVNFIDNW